MRRAREEMAEAHGRATGPQRPPSADCASRNPMPEAARFRRSPREVMRLHRMGAFHPTRLSFLRTLLRRMESEGWRAEPPRWEIDGDGIGRALYTVTGPDGAYTLVAFAHDLPDEMRSDRVIATRWDATFALFDGVPSADDLARLEENVPLQEAGRVSASELTLSRANRSVRLFDHVVERLSEGRQPDADFLAHVGYLMRTTAVYGSGKFGAADHGRLAGRAALRGPFQAEMLTVWLIRAFTVDLAEHLARARGGDRAVRLARDLRRRLGVGNSTGLGMAPFLVNHPVLLNNWMMVREEALARVRALPAATERSRSGFAAALSEARDNAARWTSDHPRQRSRLADLRADLDALEHRMACGLPDAHPWDALWRWGEAALSVEGQEALVALLLEPHGEVVDGLTACMEADEESAFRIDGAMTVGTLRRVIEERYDFALGTDYRTARNSARFWYVSQEKLEPRLGERHEEEGAELEQPLAVGRDVAALADALRPCDDDAPIAPFLMAHPEHRHAVRRAQTAARRPFAEVRENLIAADLMPIDMLRCKLSFFGATRFDPRSDRWVRISLFQDAPFPDELLAGRA